MIKQPAVTECLEAALRGTSLRQTTIANNIANLNTPNYRRIVVKFEKYLAEAITDGRRINLDEIPMDILQPRNTVVNAQGNDVNLETEVGEMIKNNMMHKTYIRLLAKMYRQMESAIQGP